MTRYAKRTSGVWLIVLLLVGCGRDEPSTARSTPGVETPATTAVRTTDPCAIALTPHTGEDRIDQEIVRLQHAARHATDPMAFLERLGWAFVAKARYGFDPGFYTLAESCALCLATQRPQSAEALLLRGHVLHNLHRFREAEGLAHQLVAQRGLAYDYGLLGDVLLEQGNLAEAIEAYQRMMDQKPSPQAYSRTAHVRWLTGDLTGALAVMRLAVGVSGFHDAEAAAWAYVRLALYELQAGLLPQASQHMEAALALQPQYPPALLTRGRMLLAEGKNAAAVAPLAHAVQLSPLPEYQWGLIEALQAAHRAEEARAIETQLMQRGTTDDRRTFALYLATTRRDTTTALQLAEAELTVRADVFTLDTLAWALHAVGRYEEARAYSGRALAEGTQEARLFYHAGVIAAAVQEPEEAAHWLAQATAIQQMLWPSEREHLATVAVAVLPQPSTLAGRQAPEPERDNSNPEGSKQ